MIDNTVGGVQDADLIGFVLGSLQPNVPVCDGLEGEPEMLDTIVEAIMDDAGPRRS